MLRRNTAVKTIAGLVLRAYNLTHQTHLDGTLTFNGITDKVEIIRDRRGVPHIYGQALQDVIFGQGFVHAQERLWQMDLYRRAVAGRVSEVLGEPALGADIMMRTLGLRLCAEKAAAMCTEEERALLDAFCAGVNACIQREPLPVEFSLLRYHPEPWTAADSLSWNYLMFMALATSWESELLRGQLIAALGPAKAAELEIDAQDAWPLILDAGAGYPLTPGREFIGPNGKDGVGSNNWVIAGSRSRSGAALLANDMHLSLSAPAIFYQNHLCCPGLDVVGVSFPGVPLVVQGHNGRVAWGFTDGFADVQDLYEEHTRTLDDAMEAEFRGEWYPVTIRREEVRVKGRDAHIELVTETRHGPIINHALLENEPNLPPLAMRWKAFESCTHLGTFLRMNRAQDCEAFGKALLEWDFPTQNVVYTDVNNRIEFRHAGDIPIRAQGDGSVPLPGWTGEHEWVDRIPSEELPKCSDTACGYIVTANNRVAGPGYPYYLGRDYFHGDRARRIIELIEGSPVMTITAMQKMQFDQVSPTACTLIRVARMIAPDSAEIAAPLAMIQSWDGCLGAESVPAAIYETWMRRTLATVLDGKLKNYGERVRGGPHSGLWGFHAWEWLAAQLDEPDSPWWQLDEILGRDAVLLESLKLALAELEKRLGPEMAEWRWGRLHQLTFGHILGKKAPFDKLFSLGPYPLGGDGGTVWASMSSMVSLDSEEIVGPPFRFTIDMADPAHAQVLFAPGQSGRPGTPHYADGIDDWFNGRYHPLLFIRDEIERDAESRLILQPPPA